jgi:hypothetical protein
MVNDHPGNRNKKKNFNELLGQSGPLAKSGNGEPSARPERQTGSR